MSCFGIIELTVMMSIKTHGNSAAVSCRLFKWGLNTKVPFKVPMKPHNVQPLLYTSADAAWQCIQRTSAYVIRTSYYSTWAWIVTDKARATFIQARASAGESDCDLIGRDLSNGSSAADDCREEGKELDRVCWTGCQHLFYLCKGAFTVIGLASDTVSWVLWVWLMCLHSVALWVRRCCSLVTCCFALWALYMGGQQDMIWFLVSSVSIWSIELFLPLCIEWHFFFFYFLARSNVWASWDHQFGTVFQVHLNFLQLSSRAMIIDWDWYCIGLSTDHDWLSAIRAFTVELRWVRNRRSHPADQSGFLHLSVQLI